jgi:hypothetical protein
VANRFTDASALRSVPASRWVIDSSRDVVVPCKTNDQRQSECFHACSGSLTARGSLAPCVGGGLMFAFRCLLERRHPEVIHVFRGSIPGRAFPCQRFAAALDCLDA